MIDWNRVKRTVIQAACGAGVALITALVNQEAIIPAIVGFVSTVAISFLMNIKKQIDEEDCEPDDIEDTESGENDD